MRQYGIRNSLLIAPMPTASTSQILGNNETFEPFTANVYTRRVLAGEFVCINKNLVEYLISKVILGWFRIFGPLKSGIGSSLKMDQFKELLKFLLKEEISSKLYGKSVKRKSSILPWEEVLSSTNHSHSTSTSPSLPTPRCARYTSTLGKRDSKLGCTI